MNGSAASPVRPRENLRATLIIFSGIVIGVFIFMLIAVFLNQTNGPFAPELNKYQAITTWGILIFSVVCFIVARRALGKGLAVAKNSLNPLNDKLGKYRSSLISYLVICEAPALLGIILYMLTGSFVFLVFSAIFLGCMLAVLPIRRRVVADLELDGLQQGELE